jgi:hypothetical protein
VELLGYDRDAFVEYPEYMRFSVRLPSDMFGNPHQRLCTIENLLAQRGQIDARDCDLPLPAVRDTFNSERLSDDLVTETYACGREQNQARV